MPSYSKSTHIVYLDLPKAVTEKIDSVRKILRSPGLKRWKAHITLKAEEDYRPETVSLLRESVADFASLLTPVEIHLGSPRIHFEDDGHSWNLYIEIKHAGFLQKMTRTLSRCLESMIDQKSPRAFEPTRWEQSHEYYAHISLLAGKDIETGKRLLSEIRAMQIALPETILCTSITLAQWQEIRWGKIASYKLQSH